MNLLARFWLVLALSIASGAVHAQTLTLAPVLLLRAETSHHFYAQGKGDYSKLLDTWRGYFNRSNTPYKEVTMLQLRELQTPATMVMASAVALSQEDRDIIEQKLAQGFSLLGTWASGVRDPQGKWLGYGQIERWFNLEVKAEVRAESEDRFLLPYGDTPLTTEIPAGKRIYLGKINEPMLRVKSANGVGRYTVWARESYPAERRLHAVSFEESRGARRVYFGFPETAWLTAGPVLDQLVAGSLSWLARQPKIAKAAWPFPAQSAFFLEMDTEDKYDNALVLAQHLEARQLRSTFYSVSDVALKSSATVKRLAQRHEIGLHGDLHNGFKGQPLAQQQERFSKQFAQMKEILGDTSRIRGFRAPLEEFDAQTEAVMRAAGIRHHVSGVNASEDLLPFFALESGKPVNPEEALMVIPRGLLDDINYVRMGISDPTHVGEVMLGAFDDVVASRGLGLFSVHSQNFFPGGVLDRQVPALLDAVVRAKGSIWFPLGTELEQWWRARERVQLSATVLDGGRLEARLKVSAARSAPVNKLRFTVIAPKPGVKPVVEGDQRLIRQVSVIALDPFRFAVSFANLDPGEHAFAVNFR